MKKSNRTPAEIAADARRTGRPPSVPKALLRTRLIVLRVNGPEYRRLKAEAKRRGVTVTELLLGPYRKGN